MRSVSFGWNHHPKHQPEDNDPNGQAQASLEAYQAELNRLARQLGGSHSRQELIELYTRLRSLTENVGALAGFSKPKRTPRMLITDAYTAAAEGFISDAAKDYSAYHIAFRRDIAPWMHDLKLNADQRYVFFGFQQIMDQFLHDPITRQEIDEADEFFKTAKGGGQFKWNRKLWDRVVDECGGIIPIKIEALRDGAVSFPGEPVIQITAKNGFGELAAWFETKFLQVWATSERATLLRYWLEYNKELVRRCTNQPLTDAEATAKAQRMLADFSDRSSMNAEESEMLGLASLTSFPTTSTLSAAYRAYQESHKHPASNTSMYSLAHRVVESFDREGDAYKALFAFAPQEIASYVADTYDFRRAVQRDLLPLALEAAKSKSGAVICARPDSGDALDQILFVLKTAEKAGLYTTVTARDGRKLKAMTTLRVIQADGMTFPRIQEINERLIAEGFSPPDCVYYGVGGYLHNALSRDNLSAAQKLCEDGVGPSHREKMKMPLDAPGKASIPGRVVITRGGAEEPTVHSVDEPLRRENQLVTWYDGIDGPGIVYREDFRDVQRRVIQDFNKYPHPKTILSPAIQQKIAALREEYQSPQNAS